MATTVTRSNYWMLKLTSNTTPVYNFKFVVDIWVDGAKFIRLKQPKNNNDSAHINFEKIVKNYIKVTNKHDNTITGSIDYDSIHLMPQNTTDVGTASTPDIEDYPLSKNTDTLKTFTFKFYEEYSTTANGTVSVSSSSASDVSYPLINYANEWEDEMELDTNLFGLQPSLIGRLLSELPYDTTNGNSTAGKIPHLTSYNDYKTFSWFNADNEFFDADEGALVYSFYEDVPDFKTIQGKIIPTGYVGTIQVDNETDNGGFKPYDADEDSEYLIFAGMGGANVKNIKYPDKGGYQLLENSNVKYYTVYYGDGLLATEFFATGSGSYISHGDLVRINGTGTIDYTLIGAPDNNVGTQFYATGTTTGGGNFWIRRRQPISKTYLFEIASDINCNSTRFDEYSLAWKNKYGTWDYYMFDGEHSDVRNYSRQDQSQKVAGSWGASDFAIESYERGKVQKVGGTKQTTINTRFITDEYNDYFNGLLMSNEVLLLSPVKKGDDDIKQVPIPINIQDTSLTYKTNLKDKLVQYSFTFEYAHDLKQRV